MMFISCQETVTSSFNIASLCETILVLLDVNVFFYNYNSFIVNQFCDLDRQNML